MIDTHCHLLPGLDDGPAGWDEALELATELESAGVTTSVCTPHVSRRYPTAEDDARARFREARDKLLEAEVPLRIELAAEIAPASLLSMPVDECRRRAIGERHVLVELQPDTPAGFPAVAVEHLCAHGLVALFAHPERCRAIQRDLAIVDAVRAEGALAQTVASSVAGAWGGAVQHAAWALLASGRVDVLASDAHRARGTAARLISVLDEVADRLGEAEVRRLTVEIPVGLLAAGV